MKAETIINCNYNLKWAGVAVGGACTHATFDSMCAVFAAFAGNYCNVSTVTIQSIENRCIKMIGIWTVIRETLKELFIQKYGFKQEKIILSLPVEEVVN